MESVHRYELKRKLATGGMGDVFLAIQYGDGGFEREVVIKRLHRHLAEQTEPLQMFREEAMLLARLGHPGFPSIFDYRLHRSGWYMAMEYIKGPSLEELLALQRQDSSPPPLDVALAIVAQAAAAIHHAHELRDESERHLEVIHGDLAPGNILLHRNGVVKIIDFGVARTIDNAALSNRLQGTLRYMSPEQVRARQNIGPSADIFALGVLLYELSTGHRPFDGSDIEVMTQVANASFEPPRSRVPSLSPKLEALIEHCLAKEPSGRPADAAELTWAVHDLAQELQLAIDPNTLAERLNKRFSAIGESDSSPLSTAPTAPPSDEVIQFESWLPASLAIPTTASDAEEAVVLQSFSTAIRAETENLDREVSLSEQLVELADISEENEDEPTLTAASGIPLVDDSEE